MVVFVLHMAQELELETVMLVAAVVMCLMAAVVMCLMAGGGDVFNGCGGDVFNGCGGDVFNGCGGDVLVCREDKLPDATPVTFMCVPLTRAGFSGQDILAAILFCPGSMTA